MYTLTASEKKRLIAGIRAAYSIPFIDDVEDFVWEAIFAYVKNIPLIDPLDHVRSKRLFDIVDDKQQIGWSIKTIQTSKIRLPCTQEIVIQRADIFKKAQQMGFDSLNTDSPPEKLGQALLHHWYEEKVSKDAEHQKIFDKRVCILLKDESRENFAYFEDALVDYRNRVLEWHWTDSTKTGLQGKLQADNQLIFRWYPNQKQLFERFYFTDDAYQFNIEPLRLAADDVVELLLAKLEDKL